MITDPIFYRLFETSPETICGRAGHAFSTGFVGL